MTCPKCRAMLIYARQSHDEPATWHCLSCGWRPRPEPLPLAPDDGPAPSRRGPRLLAGQGAGKVTRAVHDRIVQLARAGWTQRAIAAEVGISQNAVSYHLK